MKNMKIKYILSAIAVTVATAFSSCSLNEEVESFSEPSTFYQTKAECVSALNACYIPLKTIYTYKMMLATEATTDIAWAASGTQDAQLDISPAQPRHGEAVWTYSYRGVMYCNSAIAGIERSPLSEEDKAPLIGEGKIMRAFYYYLLTSFFGNVPFYTVDVATQEIQAEVAHLPRMSAVATRDSLIQDLQECVPVMDQIRTSEVDGNRAGAAMGWMLIAKMAMWNKEWDTALEAINHLEEIYGDLNQYPISDIMFRNKNTPESIFEIQHTYTAGGVNYSSNVAAICMPYPKTTGKAVYCGVEIPELGSEATAWSPMRPSPFFYGTLMYEGTADKRDSINIVHSGYNGQKFTSSGYVSFGPKFWCLNMLNTYDSNNYKVFRYADALLMKAECYCQKETDEEISVEYLNKVKRRAGLSDYRFRNWTKLFQEIMDERARELFGEFQRKFDLVRWGVWYERTYAYSGYSTLQLNMRPCHEYYPIPDKEVVYSGYALDNDAYTADGL
jgi:hypothetical protein